MRKDHEKDLSLLYYDFNNSKARLMSKMRKMSDFMIQEEAGEAEADQDVTAQQKVAVSNSPARSTQMSKFDIIEGVNAK